jgi:hypothetical protein
LSYRYYMKTKLSFFGFFFSLGFLWFAQKPATTSPESPASDGPYVLYRNNQVYVNYVTGDSAGYHVTVDSFSIDDKSAITLKVATDIPGTFFNVTLKSKLKNEKAESKAADKMLILSDIEGNFKAFRTLLQANGVIDSAFNWTFGDGQLVLSGDFVDRGDQVMEVLWLIYSLVKK